MSCVSCGWDIQTELSMATVHSHPVRIRLLSPVTDGELRVEEKKGWRSLPPFPQIGFQQAEPPLRKESIVLDLPRMRRPVQVHVGACAHVLCASVEARGQLRRQFSARCMLGIELRSPGSVTSTLACLAISLALNLDFLNGCHQCRVA